MRLLNFFKLLNKKTDGHFAITVIGFILFVINIILTIYGYGMLENNDEKPFIIFLLLSTVIHGFVLILVWMIGAIIHYKFIPFIKETIIPIWEEAGEKSIQKPGGKVKF